VATGLLWYYLGEAVFWSRVNPWVTVYAPQSLSLAAHALLGLCLGFVCPRAEQLHPAPNPAFRAAESVSSVSVDAVKDAVE
jgi:hypothetical protein